MRETMNCVARIAQSMKHTLGRLLGTRSRSVIITDAEGLGLQIADCPQQAVSDCDGEVVDVIPIPEYVTDELHFALSQLPEAK